MLEVKNITKQFKNFKAVDGLSFSLRKGDITGLLGPNGAGKTTTMRTIVSYFFPSSGQILINKKDTQKFTQETQKEIGYIPENNPLYSDMIVFDYLDMTMKLYLKNSDSDEKPFLSIIKETAKSVGLMDKLTTPINELSKGYKQRVALAAALLHNPSVLILDEPTEGLDPNQREEIRKLIKKLAKDKCILISTHVLQEVKAMCSRVIVINDGKLVTEGSIDKLSGLKTIKIKLEGSKIEENLKRLISEDEKLRVEGSKVKTVRISTKNEIRPVISEMASRHKWIIWEMTVEDDLEEIFHRLK